MVVLLATLKPVALPRVQDFLFGETRKALNQLTVLTVCSFAMPYPHSTCTLHLTYPPPPPSTLHPPLLLTTSLACEEIISTCTDCDSQSGCTSCVEGWYTLESSVQTSLCWGMFPGSAFLFIPHSYFPLWEVGSKGS